jgi:hypothetical protein
MPPFVWLAEMVSLLLGPAPEPLLVIQDRQGFAPLQTAEAVWVTASDTAPAPRGQQQGGRGQG